MNRPPVKNDQLRSKFNLVIDEKKKKEIRRMLDEYGDLNQKDRRGVTLLIYAAYHHRVELLKELLKRGADPNLQDNNGETALHYCAIFAYAYKKLSLEMTKLLIKHGADVNIRDKIGNNPLMCCGGDKITKNEPHNLMEIILLLSSGADPDQTNYYNRSFRDGYSHHSNVEKILDAYDKKKAKSKK